MIEIEGISVEHGKPVILNFGPAPINCIFQRRYLDRGKVRLLLPDIGYFTIPQDQFLENL